MRPPPDTITVRGTSGIYEALIGAIVWYYSKNGAARQAFTRYRQMWPRGVITQYPLGQA